MPPPLSLSDRVCRLAVTVRGIVQGVGFRPFVYKIARGRGLAGWVLNESDTVRIEVQGPAESVAGFLGDLRSLAPPQAAISSVETRELPPAEGPATGFEIRAGAGQAAPRPTIPADLAICAECRREIATPDERRYRYPFTNCTNCGPRWSIIRQLPYDRPRTSMAGFPMCRDCQAEYDDPADRRFHAQPVACPRCGPVLEFLDGQGRPQAGGDEALRLAVAAIRAGRIVAMKGLGGFQLLADATNDEAVARLRQRKHRPDKPFALLFRTLDDVRPYCQVSAEEARLLESPPAPIVLLRRRVVSGQWSVVGNDAEQARAASGSRPEPRTPNPEPLSPSLAPANPYLGVMLPYTPLHQLLMDDLCDGTGRPAWPIICTSGNLSEEPMAIETADALQRLGSIADCFLTHNRPIVRPVDDSVVQIRGEGLQILRRARGYAPLPIQLGGHAESGSTAPTLLAVGGHLKNTVALRLGGDVVLSSHVGDLDNLASVEVHRRAIDDLTSFFRTLPQAVACDLHPDYASTRVAESLAALWKVPLLHVQHHHAHVAAAMAEHHLAGPVLGLSWDGTGFGLDETVWGGEAFWGPVAGPEPFRRVAHLRPFRLPGGDKAIREPRRSALGLLHALDPELARQAGPALFTPAELRVWLPLLAAGRHAPLTTSMGRLFDGVAALCGLPAVASFEGQAAMALQFAAETDDFSPAARETSDKLKDAADANAYPLPLLPGRPAVADWGPLLRGVLADRAAGTSVARIARRFHAALADLALAIARLAGGRQVVLSGGCFQNGLLTELACRRLRAGGFEVFTHHLIPSGDGGIAVGQIVLATWLLRGDISCA